MTRLNLHSLAASLLPPASPAPPCTTRQNAPPPDQSAPLLLGPLPGISQLHQEASHLAQWEFERQAEDRRREMALKEAVATSPTAERDDVFGRKLSASAQKAAKGIGLVKGGPAAALKKPVVYHSHDVYRCVRPSHVARAISAPAADQPTPPFQGHRQPRHGGPDKGPRLQHQAAAVAAAVGLPVRCVSRPRRSCAAGSCSR